jgi:hypothetical protein
VVEKVGPRGKTEVKTQHSGGFRHRWLTHWITSVLLSLLFYCFLLMPFENKKVLLTLNRAGTDAVMQVYGAMQVHGAAWSKSGSRVVVVDLGPEVTTAFLTKLLEEIRGAGAIAVGLDFKIVEDPREGSDGSDNAKKSKAAEIPIDALVAVLGDKDKWGQTRVALPVVNSRLKSGIENFRSWVRQADPDLVPDEDGVVRRLCRDRASGKNPLQTLAAAMVRECDEASSAILFVPPWVPNVEPGPDKIENKDAWPSDILLITRKALTAHPTVLQGSYVVLGQLGRDSFMTPIGNMPGVLIHAEVARTLAKDMNVPWWVRLVPEWVLHFIIDISFGALAGGVFAAYAAWLCGELAIRSGKGALYSFLYGLGGLAVIGVVVLLAGILWTWIGARLAEKALLIGAVAAVFGAMLESLVHFGRCLIEPIHWLVSQVIGRRAISVLLGLLCLSSITAQAEDCHHKLKLVAGSLDDIEIEPGPRATGPQTLVEPFVRVVVTHARTSVQLDQPVSIGRPPMKLKGAEPPETASLIVPPCPPRPGLTGAWDAFWAALNPKEPLPSSGATLVYRGLGKGNEVGVSGPLRELTNLVPASGTVLGSAGLAFSWAGGSPPYSIAVEDDINGAPLGRVQVSKPWLWLPEWRTPEQDFVIIVRDAEGVELWRHLRALPPAPVAENELGDAILLFETEPAYRLEALRRLVSRAQGGDVLAGRAVALLQLSGAKE